MALALAIVTALVATALSRQLQPIGSGPSAERPLRRAVRDWLLRHPAMITAFGASIAAAGTARIVVGDNPAATTYGAAQVIAGGWILIKGLGVLRSQR